VSPAFMHPDLTATVFRDCFVNLQARRSRPRSARSPRRGWSGSAAHGGELAPATASGSYRRPAATVHPRATRRPRSVARSRTRRDVDQPQQEIELPTRERHGGAMRRHTARTAVDAARRPPRRARRSDLPDPAQEGADPEQELAHAERPRYVVVGPALERDDAVRLVALRTEDEHERLRRQRIAPQRRAHLDARPVGSTDSTITRSGSDTRATYIPVSAAAAISTS